ncbi:MAG: ribulose-phosphate 3-epimerase [Desulfobacula sp.]|jgi:ribulose-phosphate 3-epimerase|uniref:ribulose-phosphate 3-epimerase n=1 Tax=Desulfobacula sp. TaxID=2593537 RepID=UPI001D5539C9|nr:ribulose-phosphate 3-epimerase [Desulfobacula sp.]MBT4027241.1 ribulose-phosphate 3-epimerase [Desulfobacula sp.]MBT6750854.1 ribulose-phosphate 3-epimerase [Desulfobacula sp.]MBT7051850.1 ribulose-phosphate 3-epimerase [Desulfobacula sp.]MBT7629682.1 ribulose-phosphate 3-epimerase [Desulfobacula sp.]
MGIIAPSILSADFTRLGEELINIEQAGADWIHIDVMDGQFVPNISYGPIIVDACKRASNLVLDVHLMIETPDLIIPEFARAGANYISVHQEACNHLHRSLQLIKSFGIKAGVALNPATPLSSIEWIVDQLDFVLIMSVNPGFGGQNFIESSISKIKNLSKMLKEKNSNAIIQVDGGINNSNIKSVSEAGATSFVAGSAIFNTEDYKETISSLRQNM